MELTNTYDSSPDPTFKIYAKELGRFTLYWYGESLLLAIYKLIEAKLKYKYLVQLEWR